MCVESVSRGNVARSTNATVNPLRASSAASGAPAHRAPTITTSKLSLNSVLLPEPNLRRRDTIDHAHPERTPGDGSTPTI